MTVVRHARPRRPGLTLVAAALCAGLAGPALAGTYQADFSGATLDPKLVASYPGTAATRSVTSGNGVLSLGMQNAKPTVSTVKVTTAFSIVGDFVAQVTLTLTGAMEAGIDLFTGTDPGVPGVPGSYSKAGEVTTFDNGNQSYGYSKPNGYGYSLKTISTVDLIVSRKNNLVTETFDFHDGTAPFSDVNGNLTLSGPVYLSLFASAGQATGTASFSDFTVTSASVADSGPAAVAEPGSLVLLGMALVGLGLAKRRARQAA